MKDTNLINSEFKNRNLGILWNKLKSNKRFKVNSKLTADDFESHFSSLSRDSEPLSEEQLRIQSVVKERSSFLTSIKNPPLACTECDTNERLHLENNTGISSHYRCGHRVNQSGFMNYITSENVLAAIKNLKRGTSPGFDNITPEHFIYALSQELTNILANIYSIIIATSTIPEIFQKSIIIPILKKSTLDANTPTNYRPICLSSVHTKLVEHVIMPEDNVSKNQFGFRKGRGTLFATSLLNDVASYSTAQGSSLYVCSLDAEKCFDSIWHPGLLYKLMHVIPDVEWLFLYHWYLQSFAQVRWEKNLSKEFQISKGMKQGSMLSPRLFNIFINDLLTRLKNINSGIRINNFHLNVLAYADDLNLISTTPLGLQKLIDECLQYAQTWRMRFNPLKTSIVCIGKQVHTNQPVWTIGNTEVTLSDDALILGVTFCSELSSKKHVKNRVRKCQQSMFGMASVGLSYPGLNSEVKSFLWNSIGNPILLYGMESVALSRNDLNTLKTTQGNIIKRIMGINKRSHHSKLLKALKIPTVENVLRNNALRLYKNIFQTDTPASDLQSILLANYLENRSIIKGSLLEKVVSAGYNPLQVIFNQQTITCTDCDFNEQNDGMTDSLRFLLHHNEYNKPWSEEHILATLLTKAF